MPSLRCDSEKYTGSKENFSCSAIYLTHILFNTNSQEDEKCQITEGRRGLKSGPSHVSRLMGQYLCLAGLFCLTLFNSSKSARNFKPDEMPSRKKSRGQIQERPKVWGPDNQKTCEGHFC